MNISKEEFKIFVEHAFRSGMSYGYVVDHENINEDEDKFWEEFYEKFKQLHPKLFIRVI